MSAQRYWYRDGDVRDADGMPMLGHNELAHSPEQIRSPMVMRDIPDYQSPIDDRWITSRSWRREDLRRNDCYEVDPPKRKRGLINPRFAAKRGKRVCEESVETTRHRVERIADQRRRKIEAQTAPQTEWHHDMRTILDAAKPKKRRVKR